MRESTRKLKIEMKKDIWMISTHNNSKSNKRTFEQNEQSRNDKVKFYKEKWEHKFRHAETNAQKEYCLNVLMRLKILDN